MQSSEVSAWRLKLLLQNNLWGYTIDYLCIVVLLVQSEDNSYMSRLKDTQNLSS